MNKIFQIFGVFLVSLFITALITYMAISVSLWFINSRIHGESILVALFLLTKIVEIGVLPVLALVFFLLFSLRSKS